MKKPVYMIALFMSCALAVHAQTVKKVLVEEFTGAWCGGCAHGQLTSESIQAVNPALCIPAAWHHGDSLEIPECASVEGVLDVGFYPSGAIDRYKYTNSHVFAATYSFWPNAFNARKDDTAIVSVAFEDAHANGVIYTANVNVKFTAAPLAGVPLKLNVYLTEDSIAAVGSLGQTNYDNTLQNGASPLNNWFHNATMRQSLGGASGFTTIPTSVAVGAVYAQPISFTLPAGWNKDRINVIAFVAYDGDTALNRKEVLNAEQSRLSSWTALGVNDLADNALGAIVYPNPCGKDELLKISFQLKQDARVKLEVLNTLGQLVAAPYQSFEIAGLHTIQWSPLQAAMPVTAGQYFVRLSTDKGDIGTAKFVID